MEYFLGLQKISEVVVVLEAVSGSLVHLIGARCFVDKVVLGPSG